MAGRDMFISDLDRGTPEWCADFLSRDHLIPGGVRLDPATFPGERGTFITLNGAALAAATSITVLALKYAVPAGKILRFAAGKFAYTTAISDAGDTTMAVEALPAALADASVAVYNSDIHGRIRVPSGTLISRTQAMKDAGDPWHAAVSTDLEFYLTAFDIDDLNKVPDAELVRNGTVVKENNLPGWDSMSAGLKAKVRASYATINGWD